MDVKLIIYYFCTLTGSAVAALVGFFIGKRNGFASKTVRIYIALALIFGFTGAVLMGQIQNLVMKLTGLSYYVSRMRIFGGLIFTPVLMYFPVKYIAGDYPRIMDMLSPGLYLLLAFSKIGCAVYGCCYGIRCSFGLPTPFEDHLCFPVQLLESMLCFALFGLMYFIVTKNKLPKGFPYPLSLILYGVMRFFVEFLRYYPEEQRTYFFGVNFWQLVSVITVIFGVLWLIVSKHRLKHNL